LPARVAPFLQTFREYPPSQRPASFSVDQMISALMNSIDQGPGAK
jgi:arylsulfatase